MRLRLTATAGLIAFALAASEGPAYGQHNDAQREMEAGIAAGATGDYEAALAHFTHAQQLVPEANLPWRFGGETLEHLGRWEDAMASYETYSRVRPNVRDAPRIRAHIDELRAQHVEGRLDIESNPAGSTVFLDDQVGPRGETPLTGLSLRAGPHAVRVRHAGYRDAVLNADVSAGGKVVLHCELERLGSATAPVVAVVAPAFLRVPPAPVSRTPWYGRWYVWAGAGTAVVAGIVATSIIASAPTAPASQGGTHLFPGGT